MPFMDPDTAFPLQRAINAVESKRSCSIGEVGNRMWDHSDFIGLISFLPSTFFEVRGTGAGGGGFSAYYGFLPV